MGQKGKKAGGEGLSRREFLATSAAAAAAAPALQFLGSAPQVASAYEGVAGYTVTHTTCPYCSAQCGQRVAVKNSTQEIVDIYGDFDSPINSGGLCAKGAGSLQLVNNKRRLGVADNVDGMTQEAWYRVGDEAWQSIGLGQALTNIASGGTVTKTGGASFTHRGMVAIRNESTPSPTNYHNSNKVMFFGCSHANNEVNYLYRKLIATFGTSNVEHQARI